MVQWEFFCTIFLHVQKERDLELAARIGQSLLKQNKELTARNERLDERLEIAKEEVKISFFLYTIQTNQSSLGLVHSAE